MPRGGKREGAGRKAGSKNKATKDIKALAEPYGQEAIEVLVKLMRDAENEQTRRSAAEGILDRAYGKAAQAHTHADPDGNPLTFTVTFVGGN